MLNLGLNTVCLHAVCTKIGGFYILWQPTYLPRNLGLKINYPRAVYMRVGNKPWECMQMLDQQAASVSGPWLTEHARGLVNKEIKAHKGDGAQGIIAAMKVGVPVMFAWDGSSERKLQ